MLQIEGLPAPKFADDTFFDFNWTVWHEGVDIYDSGDPGNHRDINQIRSDSISKQRHNSGAMARLELASNNLLISYLPEVEEYTEATRDVKGNFSWVAGHENQAQSFRDALTRGDFRAIRSTYYSFQSHNPDARHLLSAISNGRIREMVNAV